MCWPQFIVRAITHSNVFVPPRDNGDSTSTLSRGGTMRGASHKVLPLPFMR